MEGITDKELFDQSVSNEPIAEVATPEPAAEVVQQETAAEARARDEQGRFAAKIEASATAQPPATPTTPEPSIPPGRLREETEARRAAEREAADLRAQLAQFNRQQQPQHQPQVPAAPDMFSDPEGYRQYMENLVLNNTNSTATNIMQKMSERFALKEHGKDKIQQVREWAKGLFHDPAANAAASSEDPWGALVQLYDERRTLSEIGTDTAAYKNRILDEAMKDPAFQAKVIEAARANASGQQPGARPGTVVQLPPSINRSASAASPHEAPGDLSDRSLYAFATK